MTPRQRREAAAWFKHLKKAGKAAMDMVFMGGKWDGCSARDMEWGELNWYAFRGRPCPVDKAIAAAEIQRRRTNERLRRIYERQRFNSRGKFRAEQL